MTSSVTNRSLPNVAASNDLYARAKHLIPKGTMLLAKRPEGFAPGCWPVYYKRAQGCEVEDINGNVFIDFTGDIGATLLGRADPDVNAAVKQVVDDGNFCVLNYPGEVELAQLLTEIIPCAEQVRFVRGGGEADAVAVRIARGYTDRELVAFCGYHGWHDWYLAANLGSNNQLDGHLMPGLEPVGVPRSLQNTALSFEYNNVDSLRRLLDAQPGAFAAIVLEVTRFQKPTTEFLEGVRSLADEHGVVLIFDEVVTGFRMSLGGAQEYFGVTPDMATFAKTLSNGYPMGAVVGRREVMTVVEQQFISSTYWTDAVGTAAALASVKKIRSQKVIPYVWEVGEVLMRGLETAVQRCGLEEHVQVEGWPPLVNLSFTAENMQDTLAMKACFVQSQLSRGYLSNVMHYVTYTHTKEDVQRYLQAVEETFGEMRKSIARGSLMDDINHQPCTPHFQRLT